MTLAAGSRLGAYEVVELLGAGGMGEVYRARDTRLEREVALKVLPERFALDEHRLARFEREAKLLASLNHPNVATLHGLEESTGVQALVLELVEGETLAERLARCRGKGLATEEALRIAEQIAAALEAAHEHGVIHRDLKPGNVSLKPDGTVKVLDFGLAKALEGAHEQAERGAPTVSVLAVPGAVFGTPAYMSPEQARGAELDKRTDIWAFGCVLYEMLTGRPAFAGETTSDVMAGVIEREPDLGALPGETPEPIRRLLLRCLQKDPRRRLRDIGDARLELAEHADTLDPGPLPGKPVRPAARAKRIALGAVGLAGALLAGGVLTLALTRPDPSTVARFSVAIPRSQIPTASAYQSVAVSPRGTHLAYAADDRLYVRAVDGAAARPIAGTEEQGRIGSVLFSPDGQWLAIYATVHGELRKVPVDGGAPLSIAAVDGYIGGSWGPDDRIVFAQADGIYAVPGGGGEPVLLAGVDPARERAQNPVMLPNGRGILFTLVMDPNEGSASAAIVVQPPGADSERVVIGRGTDARYLETGHLVYADGWTLVAAPFDLDALRITGTARSITARISRQPVREGADFAVSANGTLVYRERDSSTRRLVWIDRDGNEEPLGTPPLSYSYLRVSPDATRIATSLNDEDREVFVLNLVRPDVANRLTFNPGTDLQPLWMPDSRRVVFSSNRGLSLRSADGTGTVERLFEGGGDITNPNSVSPDGTELIFRRITPLPTNELWILPFEDPASARPLGVPEDAFNGEISPDGQWLAYQSNESGVFDVFLRPFPDVQGGRWQISTGGGIQPLWSPDGSELFYVASGRLLSVTVGTAGAAPSVGPPRVVIERLPYAPVDESGRIYDIAPDGRRFLFHANSDDAREDPLEGLIRYEVVLNWTEELRQAR